MVQVLQPNSKIFLKIKKTEKCKLKKQNSVLVFIKVPGKCKISLLCTPLLITQKPTTEMYSPVITQIT